MSPRHRPLLSLLLALAASIGASAGAGCGGAPPTTAVQLVLTPDPSLGSAAELLAQIDHVEVIVSAAGGLQSAAARSGSGGGAGAAGGGGGELVDFDRDGELDVRFGLPALPAPSDGALPVLELGLGDHAGRELTFRVRGLAAGDGERVVGEGLVVATVPAGQVRRVGLPFNLTSWARPPRVLLFLPAAGTKLPPLVKAVSAVLSTEIDPATVAGHVGITAPDGRPTPVMVHVETAEVDGGAFGREQRSMLTLEFGVLLISGEFKVRIGPGLASRAGRRFDQDPRTPDEEPFVSHFLFEAVSGGGVGGEPCPECPAGYGCHADIAGCVPLLSCSGGVCPDDQICDAAQNQCVSDCRVLGFCLGPGEQCDEAAGRCTARPPAAP